MEECLPSVCKAVSSIPPPTPTPRAPNTWKEREEKQRKERKGGSGGGGGTEGGGRGRKEGKIPDGRLAPSRTAILGSRLYLEYSPCSLSSG